MIGTRTARPRQVVRCRSGTRLVRSAVHPRVARPDCRGIERGRFAVRPASFLRLAPQCSTRCLDLVAAAWWMTSLTDSSRNRSRSIPSMAPSPIMPTRNRRLRPQHALAGPQIPSRPRRHEDRNHLPVPALSVIAAQISGVSGRLIDVRLRGSSLPFSSMTSTPSPTSSTTSGRRGFHRAARTPGWPSTSSAS